ncbi:hypothetical protein LTS08_007723 [Lithohypha guttulata]|nr:hypothetical protein LTS08_007723 [Lithohypha guttulata]
MAADISIPTTQKAALVHELGGPVNIIPDYPVLKPGKDEVLAQVLYTGVCQSDLHTARGTAPGADGKPILNVKLPHVGGHEGVGRIVSLGPSSASVPEVKVGDLVGIRFLARVCHECEFCTSQREQHCGNATNHLHHEDGSFQEYCVLDRNYLTPLSPDIDPVVVGPVLCAGVTAYKAVKNAGLSPGQWLVVVGAGGGLGHFAIQYGKVVGANVIGVDTGQVKKDFVESLGGRFLDFAKSPNVVEEIKTITNGGAHGAVVCSGSGRAFTGAVDMLRIGGTLSCIGIPPGDIHLTTPLATIIIRGLKVVGNLVGSMEETLEAVELVRQGKVKPHIEVREFDELPNIYEMLEKGDILGRVVLKVAK